MNTDTIGDKILFEYKIFKHDISFNESKYSIFVKPFFDSKFSFLKYDYNFQVYYLDKQLCDVHYFDIMSLDDVLNRIRNIIIREKEFYNFSKSLYSEGNWIC